MKLITLTGLGVFLQNCYTKFQSKLTTAQQNAVDSGIDSTKVAAIASNTAAIAGKQATLVSGTNIKTINSASILGSGDLTVTDSRVAGILEKIPTEASSSNKLADKTYVTNSVTNLGTTIEDAMDEIVQAQFEINAGIAAEIEALKGRGRFLSLWNAATGLATTSPATTPYTYNTGDYFIVGTIASGSGTNYKPNGATYTGTASTTAETEALSVDDVYYYDGSVWKLQQNTQKSVSFANIAGQPSDNANLASALSGKANTSHTHTIANVTNLQSTLDGKATKVASATANNFAGLDANGNLIDSGKKASDFLTAHQDISGKENMSNKVTAISSTSTDAQYPSAKCVYDYVTEATNAEISSLFT